MAEKKKTESSGKIEREYVIPLRNKVRTVPRYKKTPKAVKSIKEFLVRHMKIRDRDLKKIKIDKHLNEMLWFRGIKNPPHKIKVKAIKEGDIVRVEAIDLMDRIRFRKAREDKVEKHAKEMIEKKKSMMQKAKESIQSQPKKEGEEREGEEKKELTPEESKKAEEKKKEKEKAKAVEEAGQKRAKEQAKKVKQTTSAPKQKTAPVRKALSR